MLVIANWVFSVDSGDQAAGAGSSRSVAGSGWGRRFFVVSVSCLPLFSDHTNTQKEELLDPRLLAGLKACGGGSSSPAVAVAAAAACKHTGRMHHPDNFRSAVFKSLKKSLLSGCQDPSDHVDSAAIRRCSSNRPPTPSTAMVSVGCGHRASHHRHLNRPEDETGRSIRCSTSSGGEAQLSRVSREAERLQRVVDLWTRQQLPGVHPRSMDVAEGLLRGALELQESLAMLRELQQGVSRSKKRRSRREVVESGLGPSSSSATTVVDTGRGGGGSGNFDARNYQRIYDNPWHSVNSGSRSRREEDMRKLAADGVQQSQWCLPAAAASSSTEENTYFTQSIRFTSSSGSHFRSKSESESDGSMVVCQKKNSFRSPNLIIKLMGLEDAPGKAVQPVDKEVVNSSSYSVKMPKSSRLQQAESYRLDPDGKTFQEMIDTLKIKGRLSKSREKAVRRSSMDDSIFFGDERPPIVVIKPMIRSFDEEIMRKDINVDSILPRKEEAEATNRVIDKEIVLDQNKKTVVRMLEGKEKKTVVRMLEGKEKKNERAAGKVEFNNRNKQPLRTKLPVTTEVQKANANPVNVKSQQLPFRRKVEEVRNIKKTNVQKGSETAAAEVKRVRSSPTKVQKPHSIESSQAGQRTSTSGQNRECSVDPFVLVKEKRKTRSKPQREPKMERDVKMVSEQNNSELEGTGPYSPGDVGPSPHTCLSSASCYPEIEKLESGIPKEADTRQNDSNSVAELMTISIHDVELPFISQEEISISGDLNSLKEPECSPCYDTELQTTTKEDCRIVDDRITVISEAEPNGGTEPLLLSARSSVNNVDEVFEEQSSDLPITTQDIGNSKLLQDCCNELLQCRNYHVKLSNIAILCSHAKNTYSLYSQDQLDEELNKRLHKFRSYIEPAEDTASLGGLYWRLQMDLNCNGLMGIGGWDYGWIDGISVEEVEQLVSNIEEYIVCKLVEEVTIELVCSPL